MDQARPLSRVLSAVREGRFSYGGLLTGLYVASFCIRASFGATLILLSVYLPTGNAAYGFVIAVAPLSELVAVPLVGLANDNYGRRAILLSGLGLATVSEALRILTPDLVANLTFNAMHGVSAALILVTSLALLADWAQADSRGREMGLFDFANLLGWMVGFAGGLVLSDLFAGRIQLGFLVSSGLAFAGLLLAWPTVHEPEGHHAERGHARLRDLFDIARDPHVALIVAPWLIVFFLIGSLSTFLERLTTAFGFTGIESALGVAVFAVVLGASQVGYGRLSDRYGRAPLVRLGAWGFLSLTVTTAVLVLRNGTGALGPERILDAMPAYGPFLGVSLLAALAFGPAALAALADAAEVHASGLTMSLYSLTVTVGFIFGPVTTGLVLSLGGATGLSGLLLLLGVLLVVVVVLRNRLADLPPPGEIGPLD